MINWYEKMQPKKGTFQAKSEPMNVSDCEFLENFGKPEIKYIKSNKKFLKKKWGK